MKSGFCGTKIFLLGCLSIVLSLTFSACGERNTDEKNSSEDVAENTIYYEYVFREVEEPTYIKAAETFAGGDGTEENPYQISNKEELALFSEVINDEEKNRKQYGMAYYILTDDIVLNEGSAEKWKDNKPKYSWQTIGKDVFTSFEGNFNGDGHTISGIYINVDENEYGKEDRPHGLFGYNQGVIENVNVSNTYICVSGYTSQIGAIAGEIGYKETAKVINCNANAFIEYYDAMCGGIAGDNWGLIEGCSFSGKITAKKEFAYSTLGGIAGRTSSREECAIKNCINYADLVGEKDESDGIGGIVGWTLGGEVVSCTNYGNMSGSHRVGGIIGHLRSSNIGGDLKNSTVYLKNCKNTGKVKSTAIAGGIVGSANNDGGAPIIISDCENMGVVESPKYGGGIVGRSNSYGIGNSILNCSNSADITSGTSGGMIGCAESITGEFVVDNCTNSGNLQSNEFCAGGMIGQFYIRGDVTTKIKIGACTNSGKVESVDSAAGGIIGTLTGTVSAVADEAEILVSNCDNSGEILTSNNNMFIGGIIGGHGVEGIPMKLVNCNNSGTLSMIDINKSGDESDGDDKWFGLTRMCGGIIGRLGETLYSSTVTDKGSAENVNCENAIVVFEKCCSTGQFNVPSEGGDYTNQIGGIIGNCTAEDEFSFRVTDCKYSNADRGLGNKNYQDVGEKIQE